MQTSLLAGALTLALAAPLAFADSSSTETRSYSTTSQSAPGTPAYRSSQTEQEVDGHGNVVKKTHNYNSRDPATGESNSSSSTSVSSPDGSSSTVEQMRSSDGGYGGSSTSEKRTTTTTTTP